MKDKYERIMVGVEEAISIILSSTKVLKTEEISLLDSLSLVLAEDIDSDIDIPHFDNSAMDGYAVIADDTKDAGRENPVSLDVIEDLPAGYLPKKDLTKGKAIRIMTGAIIPKNADAVVMVEDTQKHGSIVRVFKEVKKNENIRFAGEDIGKDDLVIKKGTIIRAQEIGVLASLGRTKIKVVKKPKVAILATGDELLEIDKKLEKGKIRNSNTYTLISLVKKYGAVPVNLGIAKDNKEDIEEKLKQGFNADILLVSAGVSVGDYDYVRDVLINLGVKLRFWKVAMKPGKPLIFGTLQDKIIFGLPGNPVSSMISFEQFVRPCVLKMMGKEKLRKQEILAKLEQDIEKKPGRIHFLRAIVYKKNNENYVTVAKKQGSGIFTSLVSANSLVIIPKETSFIKKGSIVKVQLLDDPEVE